MSIAKRIMKLRKSVGWSQSELARQAGVSSVSICQMEKADRMPSFGMLIKLAKALNVNLAAFDESTFYSAEGDEKIFFRKFSILDQLKDGDQELILDIANRLLNGK